MSWWIDKVSPQYKKGDRLLGENWMDLVFVSKLAEAAVLNKWSIISHRKDSGIQTTMGSKLVIQNGLLSIEFTAS